MLYIGLWRALVKVVYCVYGGSTAVVFVRPYNRFPWGPRFGGYMCNPARAGKHLKIKVCRHSRESAGLSGESLAATKRRKSPPISSWPGLTRPSTALSGLDKDVDARIKSAQDEFKLFSISTTQVRHAGKFLSDSPARKRESRVPRFRRLRWTPAFAGVTLPYR